MSADLREHLQARLSGRYTIERELGGGMSRVFLATKTALGRKVVVKVERESPGSDSLTS